MKQPLSRKSDRCMVLIAIRDAFVAGKITSNLAVELLVNLVGLTKEQAAAKLIHSASSAD